MSIAAMADIRLQRTESKKPSVKGAKVTPKAGTPAGALNTVTAWVPTETVAAYVAVQAVLPALVAKPKTKVCQTADYSDRWLLLWVMLGLTVFLVPAYASLKSRASKTSRGKTQFEMPLLEMLMAGLALVVWAFALPDSPFDDFCGVKDWHKTLVVVVGAAVLGISAALLRKSPDWADTKPNNTPPAPDVP